MKIKNINVHFTEAEIDKKIRELGARISEDYAGESVCLICILTVSYTHLTLPTNSLV